MKISHLRLFSFRRLKRNSLLGAVSSIAHKALRPIAVFEAFKGAVVLIVGFGLLSFLGRDNEEFAERIIRQLQLNPTKHYSQIFIKAMAQLNDSHLVVLASFAALYAIIRFAEAYGLWHERRWAEWLAALSGGVYLPIEIYELMHRVTWLKVSALTINLIVVAYMVWLLTESRRRAEQAKKSPE